MKLLIKAGFRYYVPGTKFFKCQDLPILALKICFDVLFDHIDHDLVRDQFAGIDDFLGHLADRGAGGDGSAEHIAGGEVTNLVAILDRGGLGALA